MSIHKLASLHLSIYISVDLSIYHWSIYKSSMHVSCLAYQFIYFSYMYLSIYLCIYVSSMYLCIYVSLYLYIIIYDLCIYLLHMGICMDFLTYSLVHPFCIFICCIYHDVYIEVWNPPINVKSWPLCDPPPCQPHRGIDEKRRSVATITTCHHFFP